jgi:hypothetical protein
LLERPSRAALGVNEVFVRVGPVAERPACQPGKLPRMAIVEGDHDTVGRESFEALDRVGHEARFPLLTIGDHGRAGRLEPLDRLSYGGRAESIELLAADPTLGSFLHPLDQRRWPRNAPARLGWNRHRTNLS